MPQPHSPAVAHTTASVAYLWWQFEEVRSHRPSQSGLSKIARQAVSAGRRNVTLLARPPTSATEAA